jgi:hypothetical protein
MKSRAVAPGALLLTLMLSGLLALAPASRPREGPSPLERYRKLPFPPAEGNFDKGWQDRVALEHEVVNRADLKSLRVALGDSSPFVRAVAARALGIRGDRSSADALARLVQSDPEYMVRIRAVESLGLLKARPEVIAQARKDRQGGVAWAARIAEGQLRSATDDAALVRRAYAEGIRREEMDAARVGQRAPDLTAWTTDGKLFKLSSVLGKRPIAIYFAAFDG